MSKYSQQILIREKNVWEGREEGKHHVSAVLFQMMGDVVVSLSCREVGSQNVLILSLIQIFSVVSIFGKT